LLSKKGKEKGAKKVPCEFHRKKKEKTEMIDGDPGIVAKLKYSNEGSGELEGKDPCESF